MQLEGETMVITGGAQSLGLAMAKELTAAGVNLALLDVNQDRLDVAVGITARGYKRKVAQACADMSPDSPFVLSGSLSKPTVGSNMS